MVQVKCWGKYPDKGQCTNLADRFLLAKLSQIPV